MRLKKILCIILSAVMAALLCGCDFFTVDTENLLSPPRLSGDMLPISKALDESVDGEYTLKYPVAGDHRSAVVLEDINADGAFEAVAFYSTKDDEQIRMHINVIKSNGDKWSSVAEQSLIAGGIERVVFSDLDGDGTEEILVGWEIYGSSEKQLAVYSLGAGVLTQRMSEQYTGFACCDLDGDGRQEIFIDYLDTSASSHRAKLFSITDGGVSQVAGCVMDGSVKTVAEPVVGALSNGQPAIYVDGIKGIGAVTEVLYLSKGELVNPLLDNELSGENTATLRGSELHTADINSDGTLEIPISRDLPSADGSGEKMYYTNWCSYNGERLTTKTVTIFNTLDGYYITPPPSWVGSIAVLKNTTSRERTIYAYDPQTETVGEAVVRFKAVEKSKYNGDYLAGWTELKRTDDTVYLAEILSTAAPLGIEQRELEAIFHCYTE